MGVRSLILLVTISVLIVAVVSGDAPVLNDIQPTSGLNTCSTFMITYNGTGFEGNMIANITDGSTVNLSNLSIPDKTSTKFNATYNLTSLVAGPYTTYVANMSDGGNMSNNVSFTVLNPAPTLDTISPENGYNNTSSQSIAYTGSNFVSGAVVKLSNSTYYHILNNTSVSYTDSSHLTGIFDLTHVTPGPYQTYVTNPDGQFSNLQNFTVSVPPVGPTPPVVSAVIPNSGYKNSILPLVVITGSNFGYSNQVQFAGASMNLTYPGTLSGSNLTVSGLNLTGVPNGTYSVVVTDLVTGLSGTLPAGFTVNAQSPYPAPVITSISPVSAYLNSTVPSLNITGNHLSASDIIILRKGEEYRNISFGAQTATGLRVYNMSLSGLSAGSYSISVTNQTSGLSGYLGNAFTITSPLPFQITTVTDDFSTIAPYGIIEASAGSDVTFEILAKPGATLNWVQLDGTMVALDEGRFTLSNIDADHVLVSSARLNPFTLAVNMSATPRIGMAPLQVQFMDATNGFPSQWSWDFGDGSFSTEQKPSHTYTSPGVYTVSLWSRGTSGSGSTIMPGFIVVTA